MTADGLNPDLAAAARERWAKPLFLATIVTGSFLLFLTQPMVARMALPRIGGAPAVWNSAMLVYQALLLGGYYYAHKLSALAPRRQAGVHFVMLAIAALWLPIGLRAIAPPTDIAPALWVPWFLLSSIGPLFFIVSAQAPLMQRWYALESARGDPYPLYAASNLGSFAGLLAYPLAVEPLLTLDEQSRLWTGGYALLVLLVIGCALTTPAHAVEAKPERVSPAPTRRRIAHWIALAAVPSGLMLSTTTHLTTDIVAMPLIWVVPLGLYLLSFAIAFARGRGATIFITQLAPLIILIAGGLTFADGTNNPFVAATLGLSLLFFVAVTLHGEMYRLRPGPDRLTGFYLAMSVGGLLGGTFCAILAPSLFDWTYEHPLLVVAAAFLLPQRNYLPQVTRFWAAPGRAPRIGAAVAGAALVLSLVGDKYVSGVSAPVSVIASGAIALLALFSLGRPLLFAACLAALMMSYGGWTTLKGSFDGFRTRSYFGIYSVGRDVRRNALSLTHGSTLHGLQNLAPGRRLEPTTYYVRDSGVGVAMAAAPTLYGPGARIGVVGLGTGTLACYAQPGQDWRFFEIDPGMVRLARDSGTFTFLSQCAPQARMVVGDARLTLAAQPPAGLDILAIDAFSSDAVPMHLLTREAFAVYGRALQPKGLLLVHISNRYLDLEPVVAMAARAGGWHALMRAYAPDKDGRDNATPSVWVALSRDEATLNAMIDTGKVMAVWAEPRAPVGFAGWTDDHASILPLLDVWTK